MNREEMMSRILDRTEPWGMLIVGGGATGIGLKAYDFLARRTRRLFLNAHAASQAAPRVAALMAKELGYNEQWESEQVKSFQRLSERYLPDELP